MAEAVRGIGGLTVYSLFRSQAYQRPAALAIEWQGRQWSYSALLEVSDRLATQLRNFGIHTGDRVAIVSENRIEYTLLQLASARIGAIVACLNWRLTVEELRYCFNLAEPKILFFSARFHEMAHELGIDACEMLALDACLDAITSLPVDTGPPAEDPELGLLLLYTSGTTGLPKAALISQRAEIARMTVLRMDLNIGPDDAYLAWSPMFHMGGTEHTLASLMFGACVIITDGLDLKAMVDALSRFQLGWLLLVPSTIEPLLNEMKRHETVVRGVKVVGCMADLVPPALIARVTRTFDAPFLNSFGATETGLPPATGHLIPVGSIPGDLSKRLSSLCEFRLVDAAGHEVADGAVGEGTMRGPTLFSGYWNAPEATSRVLRDGWFHMGDLFRRTESHGYEFAGRSKYLIKSGGENIYPAEIERVLLQDPRIADAAVVKKADPKWGEIPVAFIAPAIDGLTELDVETLCRSRLAGYKRPREVHFIALEELPRSTTGKILREELERRLQQPADATIGAAGRLRGIDQPNTG
jgi:acyl-CoA synthetase (AMP-forming)/AMP-acid ligase II